MRKLLSVLLCTIAMTAPAWAQSTGDLGRYLRSGHPESHTVVRGDTLWGISGRFLTEPWLWPELWRVNPQIENPHLIYPGDIIRLVYVDGEPVLTLERGDAMRPVSDDRMSPRIRSTPMESAISTIDLDAIQAFLVQNRIVQPEELAAAPYVVEGESERIVLGAGDRLYVRGQLPAAQALSFVREGPLYIDPETREVLGQEATYIGLGRVVARNGQIGTMHVNESRQEIKVGDRAIPTEERRVEARFFPSAPAQALDGQIISVFGGVTQVGQFDVVVLNRGAREGLQEGNVLAIYKRGALARDRIARDVVRLPSERAGILMVFRVFEKLSYGLVLHTERPLAVHDQVRNP
jgi:nucleoid-associated protein YgaU